MWLKLISVYPLSKQNGKAEWTRSNNISSDRFSESESSAWTDGDETVESDTTASSLRSLRQIRGTGHVRILREFKIKYLLGIMYLGSLWLHLPYFPRDFTRYLLNLSLDGQTMAKYLIILLQSCMMKHLIKDILWKNLAWKIEQFQRMI